MAVNVTMDGQHCATPLQRSPLQANSRMFFSASASISSCSILAALTLSCATVGSVRSPPAGPTSEGCRRKREQVSMRDPQGERAHLIHVQRMLDLLCQ